MMLGVNEADRRYHILAGCLSARTYSVPHLPQASTMSRMTRSDRRRRCSGQYLRSRYMPLRQVRSLSIAFAHTQATRIHSLCAHNRTVPVPTSVPPSCIQLFRSEHTFPRAQHCTASAPTTVQPPCSRRERQGNANVSVLIWRCRFTCLLRLLYATHRKEMQAVSWQKHHYNRLQGSRLHYRPFSINGLGARQ